MHIGLRFRLMWPRLVDKSCTQLINNDSTKNYSSFSQNMRSASTSNNKGTTRNSATYEGEGKTHATILNMDASSGILVDAYGPTGFTFNNGLKALGPVVLFPRTALSWNVGGIKDINENSLSLFKVLDPPLDTLIIGVGEKTKDFRTVQVAVHSITKKFGIPCEVHPTYEAIGIYNFLVAERRYVAAALLTSKVFWLAPAHKKAERLKEISKDEI